MSHHPADDIIKGYVEEIHTHLPVLTDGAAALRTDAGDTAALGRMKNITVMIQGASAMVGIAGLSVLAGQMTDVLERIAEKTAGPDPGAFFETLVDMLKHYGDRLLGDGLSPREEIRRVALDIRRWAGEPEKEDAAALAPLLDGLPEYEGCTGENSGTDDMMSALAAAEEEETAAGPKITPPAPPPKLSDIPPELLESFGDESVEHLEELDNCLNFLEKDVTEPSPMTGGRKEIVRRIRRSVHTLKGAANVIGLTTIGAWGHTCEDFLDWLYEAATEIDPDIVELLTASGDLMHRIVDDPENPLADECAAMKERYNGVTGGAQETAAPGSEGPSVILTENADDEGEHLYRPGDRTLRIRSGQMDEMVNLMGELIIGSGVFEEMAARFSEIVEEMNTARIRLREIARELEIEYEVKALTGGASSVPDQRTSGIQSGEMKEDFDTLELDRYSNLHLIIRSLNETAIDAGAIYGRLGNLHSEMDGHINRQRVMLSELQDKLMRSRMLPLSTLTNRLRRIVRETAARLGKKIRLSIQGGDIELDRLFWDRLTDPLMHMIRNAADHGIEPEEERKALGKNPIATIRLTAERDGNQVVIRVIDDGAGLNLEAIRQRGIRANLLQDGRTYSREQLSDLIFQPGFSTAAEISDVSGRGVGMDVIRENIRELKGAVRVSSEAGQGTQFTVRIPLTLAAVRALIFKIGKRIFAIALNEIREIVRIPADSVLTQPQRSVRIADEIMPLFSLADILGIPAEPRHCSSEKDRNIILVVLQSGATPQALEIDGIIGQREIVIKNTGSHLRRVKGIAGVTIDGDGSVVPILNFQELIGEDMPERMAGHVQGGMDEFSRTAVEERPLSIMVVDDSVSIRQVVSKMVQNQGWKAVTARDGRDALEQLAAGLRPDLITLDIEMPRMNGYELLGALASDGRLRDIPVCMLTSRATAKHQEKAVSLGAKAFMFKPYQENEFIDLILRLT